MGAINNYVVAQNTLLFIYKLHFKYNDHIHVCILSENYSLAYTCTLFLELSRYFLSCSFTLYKYESTRTCRGRRGRDRMVVGFATNVQSVHITTNVVSTDPAHGEVYSIQHYVIKFVSDLRQVGGFLRVLHFPPPIKLTATI